MAGRYQPYNMQNSSQSAPVFDPRLGRQDGATTPRVWGVLLLLFGVLSILKLLSDLASAINPEMGAQMTGQGLQPEQKKAMQDALQVMTEETIGTPLYWIAFGAGLTLAAFSIYAGIKLLKRKAGSWKLGAIRAGFAVLIVLPIEFWRDLKSMEYMADLTKAMVNAPTGKNAPSPELMANVMSGAAWGSIVAAFVVALVLNVVLLIMITRPKVKEYLDDGAGQSDSPEYNPTMGMAAPPPGQP